MQACIILHNLLVDLRDPWEEADVEELEDIDATLSDHQGSRDGQARRAEVMAHCLHVNRRNPASFLNYTRRM